MIDFVILSAYLFEQYSYHRITISYMMPQSEVAFDETIVGGCTSVRQACCVHSHQDLSTKVSILDAHHRSRHPHRR